MRGGLQNWKETLKRRLRYDGAEHGIEIKKDKKNGKYLLETEFFISLLEKLKPNDMKKQFLLLVFALAATTLHAQREDDYLP